MTAARTRLQHPRVRPETPERAGDPGQQAGRPPGGRLLRRGLPRAARRGAVEQRGAGARAAGGGGVGPGAAGLGGRALRGGGTPGGGRGRRGRGGRALGVRARGGRLLGGGVDDVVGRGDRASAGAVGRLANGVGERLRRVRSTSSTSLAARRAGGLGGDAGTARGRGGPRPWGGDRPGRCSWGRVRGGTSRVPFLSSGPRSATPWRPSSRPGCAACRPGTAAASGWAAGWRSRP